MRGAINVLVLISLRLEIWPLEKGLKFTCLILPQACDWTVDA